MKNRFTQEGQEPVPTERDDAQSGLALLSGLAFAVAILAAASAGAEEPERVAQAGDSETPAGASDPAAEPDPAEPGTEWTILGAKISHREPGSGWTMRFTRMAHEDTRSPRTPKD